LQKRCNSKQLVYAILCACWAASLFFSATVSAQDQAIELKQDYVEMRSSIENAILAENERLQDLGLEFKQAQDQQSLIETELRAYKFLTSMHGNLLVLSNVHTKELEKALGDNRAASASVNTLVKTLYQKQATLTSAIKAADERIEITKGQLKDISTAAIPASDLKPIQQGLRSLLVKLNEKREILNKTHIAQSVYLDDINAIGAALNDQAARLNEKIKLRKKQQYLERRKLPLASLSVRQIAGELEQLTQQARLLLTKDAWVKALRFDWKSGRAYLYTFLIIFGIFQYFLLKFRRYLDRFMNQTDRQGASNLRLMLKLLRRSVLLAGTALLAYLFLSSNMVFTTSPFYQSVSKVLLIILLTRWGRHFAKIVFKEKGWLEDHHVTRIASVSLVVRYVAIVYVGVEWLYDGETILLFLLRIMAGIYLLFWLAGFWKSPLQNVKPRQPDGGTSLQVLVTLASGWSYSVVAIGLIFDIAGYPLLAVYWLTNWGITVILFWWTILSLLSLQEWRQRLKGQGLGSDADSNNSRQPFRWLVLQAVLIFWLVAVLLLLIFTWGGKGALISNLLNWLTYPINIGKISFSLINLVYAFIALVLTHMLTKVWRYLIGEKVLVDSGLETGLQDSIITITVYTLWVFGILISLHIFGFGTTTLALAFGALGIGLGFGLQNIFNNFISGIILLFERPIQVGDDVEINGTWATVKKINVRATVVQTYDNASLIIPNSEFISAQVTNWSFKDKRLRRHIEVGVAYGSDIELVRSTLLEIAAHTKNVLKNPKPDVIFRDFGDSALLFRLRIWTDIDNMLIVETAIRFDIDRLFKERGIVIAFPQRDVHLFVEDDSDGIVVPKQKTEPT